MGLRAFAFTRRTLECPVSCGLRLRSDSICIVDDTLHRTPTRFYRCIFNYGTFADTGFGVGGVGGGRNGRLNYPRPGPEPFAAATTVTPLFMAARAVRPF